VKAKSLFVKAKKKMLSTRQKRQVPRDDKLLAAWNGLVLSAYSKAAKKFKSKRYAKAAQDIKRYIHKSLWINKRLVRAVKNGKVLGAAGLEDYSYIAQGLHDWLQFSHNQQDQLWLEDLIEQTWKRFHGKQGWLLAENSLLKYGQGEAVVSDGVLPSASAILIKLSLNVAENNNIKLKKKALQALNVGHGDIVAQPFWYASQIHTLYDYQKNH